MQNFKTNLKNAIMLGIVSSGAVLPIRIQELDVDHNFSEDFHKLD
jgi:hypothetical protein